MGCANVKGQASEPGKKEQTGKTVNEPAPDNSKQLNQAFTVQQEDLIKLSEGNIYDFYDFKNRLGEGGYGSVFHCIHNKTNMSRAVKIVNKTKMKGVSIDSLFNEINLLKSLDHANIMKIYEYFNDENYLYVVGELIEGGELFDFICDKGSLDEKKTAEIIKQLLSTIYFLHSKNIVHRDIKPENILLTSKAHTNLNIKLIDFGISVVRSKEEFLTQKIGTPMYVAPEVLAGKYDEKCDEWSTGVILYVLLTGYPPFQGRTQKDILKSVQEGVFSKEITEYQILSSEAKDLINGLLTKDPVARLTAEKALQHPWFNKVLKSEQEKSNETRNIVNNLQKYRAERKIQLVVFYFFSHLLALQEETEKLMEAFRAMDKDSNGTLTKEELIEYFKKSKKNSHESENMANEIIKFADLNNNNKIDYSEFVAGTIQKEKMLGLQKIESVFKIFDKDGDEKISLSEFKNIFAGQGKIDEKTWQDVFKEGDQNNDNFITLNEFKEILMKLIKS